MLKKFFSVPNVGVRASLALLCLRVVIGVAFMMHGWGKIQTPFGWMGPDATTPGILQALAALSEFGGGFAWVVGALTPLASLGILSTMCVAVSTHMGRGDPFVGKGGSYELAAAYLVVALVLFTVGPGGFSLDRLVFGSKKS